MWNNFYVEMISQRVVLNNEQIHICNNLCENGGGKLEWGAYMWEISSPILREGMLDQVYIVQGSKSHNL
jgi:hypothetical protein